MARTTRTKGETRTNGETSSRTNNKTTYKTASQLGNNVKDVEIINVRKFKDNYGNLCCYFTLNLGFITIYSMLYLVDRKGNGYIKFPEEERNGEYYSTGYIESNLADFIVDELEENYL